MDLILERAHCASDILSQLMAEAASDGQAADYLPSYLAHRISARPELLNRLMPGNHIDDIRTIDSILDRAIGTGSFKVRRKILEKTYRFVKDPSNAPRLCGSTYFEKAAEALPELFIDQAVSLASRMERLCETIEVHMHVGFPLFDDGMTSVTQAA